MKRSLGISFSSDKIYFTEVTGDNEVLKLDHTSFASVDFDFEDEMSKHKSVQRDLDNVAHELSKYISKRNRNYDKVSVCISTSQAFILKLPIDYSEGKQSLTTKVYWELSHYLPDDYNDYVINTYRLNQFMPLRESDYFILIAVHKFTIEFIKRVFKLANINIDVIDIDYFASEYALRQSSSAELENKKIALIGLKDNRIDFGFIDNKKFKSYTSVKFSNPAEFNLTLVKKLNLLLSNSFKGAEKFIFYGDEISEDTVQILQKNGIKVDILNPFESVYASDKLLNDDELRGSVYKYSPSCGAAIRGLKAS